ncbi:MAG: transposase [Gammaproteobacteria bacterium]
MPPLPEAIIAVLSAFAPMFSCAVWTHAQVLLVGALLCQGPRTVAAALCVLGLGQARRFEKYHRVLSRARWSGLQGAKLWLGFLIELVPPWWPVLIVVDETVERRQGRKIKAKGRYRDAVRSTQKVVVKCYGLKWISMMVLVPLPWSARPWALPFLTVLAPSKRANEAAGKRHKSSIDWTEQRVKQVARWLGQRRGVLIGDGGFACVRLALTCVKSVAPVTLISRLRLDAPWYDFPPPQQPGRRGPQPQKGRKKRQALKGRIEQAKHHGKETTVAWYGGKRKRVRLLSGQCLWHTSGFAPVPIRWVLVVDPTGKSRPEAFFSTDRRLTPEKIVEYYVLRWNVEVTFEEGRRHLGLESQRQWSDQAIARTTPALLGLYSLICLMAHRLTTAETLLPRSTAWYGKTQATFSDVLAFVRRAIWAGKYFNKSTFRADQVIIHRDDWEVVLNQLASTA